MSAATNKRTICKRKYSGFVTKSGRGVHTLIKPSSLPIYGDKPLLQDTEDVDLTLITEAEELLLDRQCNIDDVANLVAITTYDLLTCEQQYLKQLGFRIVLTRLGELNNRKTSLEYFQKVHRMW